MSLIKLVFIGAPGAGKGTQAKLLPEFYPISTGEVIRTAFRNHDPILSRYQEHIEKGGLLPDELIFNLIEQEIRKVSEKYSKGYILDGAVRTLPQAKFVREKNLGEIFINFDISDKETKKRIEKRRIIEDRKEDLPEAVEKRFQEYNIQNPPVLEYLSNHSRKYFKINASQSISKVHKELLRGIKKYSILL